MATIPDPIHKTASAIYRWYEEQQAKALPRQYLGWSIMGHACERYLWLSFRLAEKKSFEGRMLRLFDTGHREEVRIISELRAIGAHVVETAPDGSQWGVSDIGGHLQGHMDAAAQGLPESKQWAVVEMKTHNIKSFADLKKNGVEKSKPMHFAQMQGYMGQTGMERALYFAVCKDTDEIHTEWIHFDPVQYAKYLERGRRIITAAEPPMRISNDPSWFECKWCDMYQQCHGTTAPLVNCRTCAHSTPELDGDARWSCAWNKRDITFADQLVGCDGHRVIPAMISNWTEMIDANGDENWVKYRNKLTGAEFYNGDLSSQELRDCEHKEAIGEAGVQDLRHTFEARIGA